jgi:hypothetical protein
MPVTAVATLQGVWDCKWSRPGYRLSRVSDRDQPESQWVCVREGKRTEVGEAQCGCCPFWDHDSTAA